MCYREIYLSRKHDIVLQYHTRVVIFLNRLQRQYTSVPVEPILVIRSSSKSLGFRPRWTAGALVFAHKAHKGNDLQRAIHRVSDTVQ